METCLHFGMNNRMVIMDKIRNYKEKIQLNKFIIFYQYVKNVKIAANFKMRYEK